MATTVTAAPLSVTFKESIELTGSERGSSIKSTIESSVVEYLRTIRAIPNTAFRQVLAFSSTPLSSGDTFDSDLVKYVRITNLDTTDSVAIAFRFGSSEYITLKIPAGMHFMMGSPLDAVHYQTSSAGQPQGDVASILARGQGSGDIDIEVVVGAVAP